MRKSLAERKAFVGLFTATEFQYGILLLAQDKKLRLDRGFFLIYGGFERANASNTYNVHKCIYINIESIYYKTFQYFVSYVDENIKPHTNARSSFDQRAVFARA